VTPVGFGYAAVQALPAGVTDPGYRSEPARYFLMELICRPG
jgi:hypothetical protein